MERSNHHSRIQFACGKHRARTCDLCHLAVYSGMRCHRTYICSASGDMLVMPQAFNLNYLIAVSEDQQRRPEYTVANLAAVAARFASTCRLMALTGISFRDPTKASPSRNSASCFVKPEDVHYRVCCRANCTRPHKALGMCATSTTRVLQ